MIAPLDSLPDDSRLWTFGADRSPTGAEAARILDRTERFLEEWTAHREALTAGFEWRYNRFACVAVDEGRAAASGCSIDALVAHMRELETDLGLRLTESALIWYREEGEGDAAAIRTIDRPGFRRLSRSGDVGPRTIVFDLTVDRLAGFRSGSWELPARESWHADLLSQPEGAAAHSPRSRS